jgi:hypothetical protein
MILNVSASREAGEVKLLAVEITYVHCHRAHLLCFGADLSRREELHALEEFDVQQADVDLLHSRCQRTLCCRKDEDTRSKHRSQHGRGMVTKRQRR